MPALGPLGDKLRDKIAELLIAAAYKTGKFDSSDRKTREVMEALTDIIYGTVVFIIDSAKSGGNVEKVAVVDFITSKLTKQLGMLGNKIVDCVFALAGFAVDTAVLAPIIQAGIVGGGAATASGLGAPVGLSVIAAAAIAATFLTIESIEADRKCQEAINEAYAQSSESPAGGTQIKVNAQTLSANSLDIFNFLAKTDRQTVLQCSL